MSWGPILSNVGRSLGPHLWEWVDALKFDKARPPSAYNTIAEYVIWISNSCRHTNSWDHKVASTQMKSQSALWLWPDWHNKGQLKFHVCKGTRQIWGIWKLRPAYSPETPNSGQKRWCFVPCDLEIWWMTLGNNRAPLLCCFKLCATFHNHQWIQTGVAVQKRPISVKFDDF